jgi:hypothetical protein
MRRVLVLLLAALALAVAAGAARGVSTAGALQGNCKVTQVTVLFWPQGHGIVRSVGFPEFRLPHVEVYAYKAAATFRPANQLAYAGTDQKNMLMKGCARTRDTGGLQQLPSRSLRAKAAVTCSLSKPANVQLRKVAGSGVRSEVYLIEPPNKIVLSARLAARGSTLSYSSRQCRAGAAPG